ncbi:PREDICTED: KIF1-binding protein homolog isoform X2 [Nicrophorus vespilloides]|uniref:KIF-binding protein n=1 Tax=Nicrophorus vespilloides TaxID=110193 RepID=A0ABM1NC07_NICVS|nr:PREDICTED: KIF1-binding protein homolog isoform X2 [Nicrophorus vespilloides]
MAALSEATCKELEDLFENLKKTSQKPEVLKHDAGDKTQQNLLQEMFVSLQTRLDEIFATVKETEGQTKVLAMKSSLFYENAKIKLTVDDFAASKENLDKALEIIKDYITDPFMVYLHLRIINHLAFTLSKLGDYEKAKELLEEITTLEAKPDVIIYSTEELFAVGPLKNSEAKVKMHSINMNNLQMLSWIYSKMGLEKESAYVQHRILELELDYEECDPVDWAMRCTRVASLYLVKMLFVPARYYLSAAGSALDRVEAALIDHPELGKAQAELARGWIYYGLRLFDTSKSRDITKLCNKIFDDVPTTSSTEAHEVKLDDEEDALDDNLKFPNSEVKIAKVPAKFVNNTVEAHILFQHTQMWLKRARVYYTLRDYPFIYVNCVLDLSELYRFLAFYEPDLDSQYNVQKRRADALETLSTILKEVRPQCYIAVSVELLRELAEVQIELMGINLKRMYKMHDVSENQESLRRRMEGVYDIQSKLEKIGNMFGHGNLEETEMGAAGASEVSEVGKNGDEPGNQVDAC